MEAKIEVLAFTAENGFSTTEHRSQHMSKILSEDNLLFGEIPQLDKKWDFESIEIGEELGVKKIKTILLVDMSGDLKLLI